MKGQKNGDLHRQPFRKNQFYYEQKRYTLEGYRLRKPTCWDGDKLGNKLRLREISD